ncbi:hypothetical protein D9615_003674 [Tricholomella constricta]|uniref:ATP-dependent DNA ligase family profile domain-containing protein n=1 Tax=Tricholomella constricta TaxID=117010 RepID=A0A8H5HI83_9AGAR|nr:hypothetical protein D9615_003674 [Tricholomella constricta]
MSHARTPSDLAEGVPFSFFCSLLREISQSPSHKAAAGHRYNNPNYPALTILRRWVNKLRKDFTPLPAGTSAIVFKLLFPDEDHGRKFDMQETRLSQNIADCFGIDKGFLGKWFSENASGCLGEELKLVLERTCASVGDHISPLSIAQVDELLDELASTSGYSDMSIRKKYPQAKRRARLPIIKDLFRTLSPMDAGFLTQIILKDLRPILYPLRETHYIAALLGHNTASVKMLSKEDAMNIWDPTRWMLNSYRVRSTIAETANRFELSQNERGPNVPRIGAPVTIPESEKGRSPRHALEFFRQSQQIWAETKYDGERAQIHVEVLLNKTKITIFSKSKRDSTWDRKAVHDNIFQALGLSEYGVYTDGHRFRVQQNVILDAEMVVFNGERIDEFWRIKGLIEKTASGIRGKREHGSAECQSSVVSSSQSSMSLLMRPYCQRRKILEGLIHVIPGISILSERVPVSFDGINYGEQRQIALEKIFSGTIANCQEGLVLKGGDSKYHDFSTPWVKLKKDYIPEYGDTLDMVIVGVGWDRERARVLRVPPSTITTFYIGGLENSEEIKRQPSCRPHFQLYFTVSYGLDRRKLEEINFMIHSTETVPYSPSMNCDSLGYTFTLLPGLQHPRLILKTPLLAELFGAGFTKAPQSRHYELRFPRLTKVHRPNERGWQDGVNLQALHKIACEVVGRDSSSKEARNISAQIWGKPASPGAKSSPKRKATGDLWEERFASMDGRARVKARINHSRLPSPARLSYAASSSQRHRTLQPLAPKTNLDPVAPVTTAFAASQDRDLSLEIFHLSTSRRSRKSPMSCTESKATTNSPIPTVVHKLFMPQPAPAENIYQPLMKKNGTSFLENALVWLAKPRGKTSYSFRWVKTSIPRAQQLHSVESLLMGCGWCAGVPGSTWADRGIIFIDESDAAGKDLARHALRLIYERSETLPADHPRKTIWIFDRKSWTFDAEDVEHQALHRLK